MNEVKKAMISSTARDLPLHREQVQSACHRLQVFASEMMENLTAENANAVEVSLRLVDQADVYIGIFAHRYGFVPDYDNPDGISITEMEYKRAVERKIPCLIFFMHDDHELKIADVETGPGAEKLKQLKQRIGNERVAAFFKNPEDLRAHVIQALSQWQAQAATGQSAAPPQFHSVLPLTRPPEPYVAHPYVLSQATGLIGRQAELNLLTDWITAPPSPPNRGVGGLGGIRIFNVIAIGGMGKSALTWEWFQKVAPLEWPAMAGRFWWSFYESDAYFENFVLRALAYVSCQPIEALRPLPAYERENQLLAILDREPHLLVLDGLERILIAYARMDAAFLQDDEYDRRTANYLAQAQGLCAAQQETFLDGHRLRKTADPRAGQFLKRLARVQASRILVSSRLYPFDLQNLTGDPMPGCAARFLDGLRDDDALALWRHFGCTGGRDALLRLFRSFGSHPLLLQALAGEVARYRPARGDFERWQADHPGFSPFTLDLKQAKAHVLQYAMQGLTPDELRVLQTIAAFRMPTQYQTLLAVCAGADKPCADAAELDRTLTQLEDRGLLGWDKNSDRYDLHPVVRGVTWAGADTSVQQSAYSALQSYFEAAPKIENYLEVNVLEDLSPAIELYYALIGLGEYDAAFDLYYEKLNFAMLYRLGSNRQRGELIEKLFLNGLEKSPQLGQAINQAYAYNELALAYEFSGEPGRSIFFFEKFIKTSEQLKSNLNAAIGLGNLSDALRLAGQLCTATEVAQSSLDISQSEKARYWEAVALQYLGSATAAAGQVIKSKLYSEQSRDIFIETKNQQYEGLTNAYLAQHAMWHTTPAEAQSYANRAWELAHVLHLERDLIRAACRQGQAALGLGDQATASERLHYALTRARAINLVEEELPALIALAELARQQGQPAQAREYLDDVWEAAERGPYPILHADACNVLCQLERDAGNRAAALAAAQRAYDLAWCGEGPPWAYHFGLESAKRHLEELGEVLPIG